MTSHTLRCWLSLHRVSGLGPHTLSALLGNFGTIEGVFAATRAQLEAALGARSRVTDHLLAGVDPDVLAHDLAWLDHPDHNIVTYQDPAYPWLLREIVQPPLLLFVAGDIGLLARPQLAVVGSRNPTPAGVENAHAFAYTLAQTGLTITSGLALGIDGAAHRGALDAGETTVAVLGTGVDRIYPPRHQTLVPRIVSQGAVVSEFPLGTPPKAENFPRRNRVISGLSLGTLVVEAALQSGSLITAHHAVEQGREVFAVPGSIHSPLARGCHALIREGAKLVETAHDIIEELGALAQYTQQHNAEARESRVRVSDPHMSALLEHIGHDPVSVDTLVERSGLTPHSISSMLVEMELLGVIAACPGGKYVRSGSAKGDR
ncbi:MAG: DNA-processing protein DprA [Acidiferrobacterales bacterium]